MHRRVSNIGAAPSATRSLACLISLLLGLGCPVAAAEPLGRQIPDSVFLERVPSRSPGAITGSEFAQETSGLTGRERQAKAVAEIRRGNIPHFLRGLKPVSLSGKTSDGEKITAVIWVTPDYFAIGSDEDFLRIPLTYPSAVAVARAFGCVLPTRKMVDAIYEQATCHLKPDPLPPGPMMRSSEYYLKHRDRIRDARKKAGCALGELVSGHKKDVVLTNRLTEKPGRIAIYGWHRVADDPIQPLSTVHGEHYADYSHGLRLIYGTVWVNRDPRSILEVLQDPRLAPVLTYEGIIEKLLKLLRLK